VKDHLLFLLFTKSAAPRKVPPRGIAPSPFVGALIVTDLLYLQFKSTICALNYPRKHTSCTITLQERHFQIALRHREK